MTMTRNKLFIDSREIIPIRLIRFITGGQLSADKLTKIFAKTHKYHQLNLNAYRLHNDNSFSHILPKEWDAISSSLASIRNKLKTKEQVKDKNYKTWIEESTKTLPPAVFVWKDEFENEYNNAFSKDALTFTRYDNETEEVTPFERQGERELNYSPLISSELEMINYEGFEHLFSHSTLANIDLSTTPTSDNGFISNPDPASSQNHSTQTQHQKPLEHINHGELIASLDGFFKRQLADLPEKQRKLVELCYLYLKWDDYSEEERRSWVNDWEYNHDLKNESERERDLIIGYYSIKKEWDYWAKKPTLVAIEAIPLMNGCDPSSWRNRSDGSLPKEMVVAINRGLSIAKSEGVEINPPVNWLAWGKKHGLDSPTITSAPESPEPDVCMWPLFESAVENQQDYVAPQSIDNEAVTKSPDIRSNSQRKPLDSFPEIDGLQWEDISISFFSNEAVTISAKELKKKYTFAEMGFKDGRKGDVADSRWKILKEFFAKNNGEISWETPLDEKNRNNLKKAVQDIRKRLKEFFGISEDPFYSYKKLKAYKLKLSISDDTYS